MSRLALALVLFTSILFAQEEYDYFPIGSLEADLSVRSIALGSSLSSAPDAAFSADQNPANIALIKSFMISASHRENDFRNINSSFYSAGIVLPTTIGNFSFIYKNFKMPNILLVGIDSENKLSDHTFILSYGRQIIPGLSAGINLKSFTASGWDDYGIKYYTPVVLDAGIQYSFDGPVHASNISDRFSFGAVLQNYGSDFGLTVRSRDYYLRTPRYFKLGASYLLDVKKNEDLNFLSMLFTLEYKNHLNTLRTRGEYLGFGIESKILDLVSLRLGGVYYPNNTIYAKEKSIGINYGAGINIPFERFGLDFPLQLCFDYANIRLEKEHAEYFDIKGYNAFNAGFSYSF